MSKTCTRCGETKPLDGFHRHKGIKDGRNPRCKECRLEYNRRYYEGNRDKVLERNRRYREENRDELLEYNRRYYEDNRDKWREYGRRYSEDNRDKIRERKRRYHEENRDKFRELKRRYREDNLDERREYDRRYYKENRDILNQENKIRQAQNTRTSSLLASKKGTHYSPEEDALLLTNNGMTLYQKAVTLGRTYTSCKARLQRLRARANH